MQQWGSKIETDPRLRPEVLEYLVHLIVRKLSYTDKYEEEHNGYVPLYSCDLKQVSTHYRKHLLYLQATEVIQIAESYSTIYGTTKGYRLKFRYKAAKITAKQLTTSHLKRIHIRVSIREAERMQNAKRQYPYLTVPLDGLRIDREAALSYVDRLELACLLFHGESARRRLQWRFNIMRIRIERIAHRDHSFLVDEKGRRFHSNLTSLNKELRHFLTYRGQPLGGVDIKNSQPYLSQVLLRPEFWEGRLIDNRSPSTKSRHRKKLEKGEESPETKYMHAEGKIGYNDVLQNKVDITTEASTQDTIQLQHSITDTSREGINMLLARVHTSENQDITLFRRIVNIGLYEYLMEQIPLQKATDMELQKLYEALGNPEISRDYVKKLTMVALYSHPSSSRKQSVFARRILKHHFPTMHKVFAAIKKGKGKSYTLLPIILQRVEALLVLDRICREFWRRYRQPVYTIHDGLITTADYIPKLKEIAERVLTKAVGARPKLEPELWSPDYLQGTHDAVLDRMLRKQKEITGNQRLSNKGRLSSILLLKHEEGVEDAA